jgi:hypothetical protein
MLHNDMEREARADDDCYRVVEERNSLSRAHLSDDEKEGGEERA